MDEQRLTRLRGFSHPVSVLLVVVPFVWLLDSMLRVTVLRLLFTPLSPLAVVVTICFQVEALVSTNSIAKDQASVVGKRIRELVGALVVSVAAFMFIGGYIQAGIYNPLQPSVIYSTALTFAAWLITISMHKKLKAREAFLKILVGKQRKAELQESARSASSESGDADEGVRKFRRHAIALSVISVVLYVFVRATGAGEFAAQTRLLIVLLTGAALAVMGANGFLWENDALIRGVSATGKTLGKRYRSVLLFSGVVVLVSLPLAGKDAVVPPSAIDQFMRRVTNRDRRIDGRIDTEALFRERRRLETEAPPGERQSMGAATDQQQRTQEIARVVGLTLAGALALGIIYFLLSPLFSRDVRERLRGLSLKRILTRLGNAARDGWRSFTRGIRELFRSSRRAVQEARRAVQNLRESIRERQRVASRARGGESRREVGKLLRIYIKLSKWGEKAGYSYQKWMGPYYYCNRLAAMVPERADDLKAVGNTFEALVYGPHTAQPHQIEAFGDQVEAIIRNRPKGAE
jgi:hypothetical protein